MEAVGQGVGNRIESAREGSFPCQCQSSNLEPVSTPSMRVFALRRPVAFLALLFVTILAGAKPTFHRLYPNELKGLKFYAKYLAPLRPGVSREEAVRRVLGDTAAVERNGWIIITTYAMKSGPLYSPTLGSLAEIIVRPDTVIPMGAVKFPRHTLIAIPVSLKSTSPLTYTATGLGWSTGYMKRTQDGGRRETSTELYMGQADDPTHLLRFVSC
jgi:hypothetical protein